MTLISTEEVQQFRELGYFVTGVVFSPGELEPMAAEMDRVYAEHVREAEALGDAPAVESARGRRPKSRAQVLRK